MSKNTQTSGGIGFFGLLTVLFIGLKLAEVISWSWWLVLLPMYWFIPLIVIAYFIALTLNILNALRKKIGGGK